jgi:hypothetical protein
MNHYSSHSHRHRFLTLKMAEENTCWVRRGPAAEKKSKKLAEKRPLRPATHHGQLIEEGFMTI